MSICPDDFSAVYFSMPTLRRKILLISKESTKLREAGHKLIILTLTNHLNLSSIF